MDWVDIGCTTLIRLIERLGFPIFVAVWVLIVQQKALNKLTKAINHLTNAVDGNTLTPNPRKKGGD